MMLLLLAIAVGTVPVAWETWWWLGFHRRQWQKEQTRRQNVLMQVDVVRWTDYIAWTLATRGESAELDGVRPLPRPTLWHMGDRASDWAFRLLMWLGCVGLCWIFLTFMLAGPLPPLQKPSVVLGMSVAEGHAMCAQIYAWWPEEIPACCLRQTGVPCSIPGR
jgi:hypothetical protein